MFQTTTTNRKTPIGKRKRQRHEKLIMANKGCISDLDVIIRIPKHSSVLSQRCVRDRQLFSPASTCCREEISCELTSGTDIPPTLNLELWCHHPGVIWRGLLPMIFSTPESENESFHENSLDLSDFDEDEQIAYKPAESDLSLPSSQPIYRYKTTATANLPQYTLLGLGLKEAVARYGKNMDHPITKQKKPKGCISEEDALTDDDGWEKKFFYQRKIRLSLFDNCNNSVRNSNPNKSRINKKSVMVWIFPPLTPPSDIDRTPFARILSKIHTMLSIQHSWNAWLSTLGGGYFGIKNLEKSLWLSKQQRSLALWFGDAKMARQCILNEAYNWMYAGRFKKASSLLDQLEDGVTRRKMDISNRSKNDCTTNICSYQYTTDDGKLLQQCFTARVCLRRLKRLSQQGLKRYHQGDCKDSTISLQSRTIDDLQRFRIVSF